jgi:hypothetical protein
MEMNAFDALTPEPGVMPSLLKSGLSGLGQSALAMDPVRGDLAAINRLEAIPWGEVSESSPCFDSGGRSSARSKPNHLVDHLTGVGGHDAVNNQHRLDPITPRSGFSQPYAGTPKYEHYAPTQASKAAQINRPLGQLEADRIAKGLGLNKKNVFTPNQYRLFISGQGVGGQLAPAKLVDESVRILTNTIGRPLYASVDGVRTPTVLASYGLMVNTEGLLQSPANASAPTRQVNSVIEPGGYLDKWCRQNGATASLRDLYRSAFTSEAVFGNQSQQQSGTAQLVPHQQGTKRSTVGMSMAPSIWNVNFALIYILNPQLAAKMPAYWTPIPSELAKAIERSPTGQVSYSKYASLLAA